MRDALMFIADLAGDPSVIIAIAMLPVFAGLAGLYWTWAWLWSSEERDD